MSIQQQLQQIFRDDGSRGAADDEVLATMTEAGAGDILLDDVDTGLSLPGDDFWERDQIARNRQIAQQCLRRWEDGALNPEPIAALAEKISRAE